MAMIKLVGFAVISVTILIFLGLEFGIFSWSKLVQEFQESQHTFWILLFLIINLMLAAFAIALQSFKE